MQPLTGQLRVLIEGWRFVPHSYALIAAGMVAEMRYDRTLDIRFLDRPYCDVGWKAQRGYCSPFAEKVMASLEPPESGWHPDLVVRIDYPMRLEPVSGARTVVFGTTEYGRLLPGQCNDDFADLHESVTIMTPSTWSRRGFLEAGAPPERVIVVPHGVDTEVFFPLGTEERARLRRQLGWHDRFVVLNIGAMTPNKGVTAVLGMVACLAKRHDDLLLCLKGLASVYDTDGFLRAGLGDLSEEGTRLLVSHSQFIDETLLPYQVAKLYQAADLYVSPYQAEGFNLPVLEAMATGLPVICTAGGSTDDFMDSRFGSRIQSALVRNDEGYWCVQPDRNDFARLVEDIYADRERCARIRSRGPGLVRSAYTWKQAVGHLFRQVGMPH